MLMLVSLCCYDGSVCRNGDPAVAVEGVQVWRTKISNVYTCMSYSSLRPDQVSSSSLRTINSSTWLTAHKGETPMQWF